MRTIPPLLLVLFGGLAIPGALAQTPAAPAPPQAAAQATPAPAGSASDPVVARVNGAPLLLSEAFETAGDLLPAELRALPPATLRAMIPAQLVDRMIDRAITERVLLDAAIQQGLEQDPEVQRRLRRAREQELQQALLGRILSGAITEDSLRARYEQEVAKRGGEEEVRARHILLPTEAAARQALAEVQRPGADFAAIARRRSTDSSAGEGGDLGFFARGAMVPEFAEAAFALQPGQVAPAPVKSQFGWHVIKVEARRTAPVPSFDEAREGLQQRMMEEQLDAAVKRVRDAATIERLDQAAAPPAGGGSLLDNAAPPPPPTPRR